MLLTLHTAALVGPGGLLETFEPNPAYCRRIDEVLELNRIGHVRLHRVGLSDSAATLTLSVLSNHTGMGTLATVDATSVTGTYSVPVVTADSMLLSDSRPVALVKIDVEGFETRVLRGMAGLLKRWRPIVTNELICEWLERSGSSAQELFDLMHDFNYRGYGLRAVRRAWRYRLHLEPIRNPHPIPPGLTSIVWSSADAPVAERLAAVRR